MKINYSVLKISSEERMRMYDLLPPPVRKLVRNGPADLNCWDMHLLRTGGILYKNTQRPSYNAARRMGVKPLITEE